MDIIGLGTDIVECARVRAMIDEHDERFLTRVYSPAEIRWCQSRKNATEHFAAFWAAKEAVAKCLSLASRGGAPWSMIEIANGESTPKAHVTGALREHMAANNVGGIMLSMAFSRHYATATALALRGIAG